MRTRVSRVVGLAGRIVHPQIGVERLRAEPFAFPVHATQPTAPPGTLTQSVEPSNSWGPVAPFCNSGMDSACRARVDSVTVGLSEASG